MAGIAVLFFDLFSDFNPTYNYSDFISACTTSAISFDGGSPTNWSNKSGYGMIDAYGVMLSGLKILSGKTFTTNEDIYLIRLIGTNTVASNVQLTIPQKTTSSIKGTINFGNENSKILVYGTLILEPGSSVNYENIEIMSGGNIYDESGNSKSVTISQLDKNNNPFGYMARWTFQWDSFYVPKTFQFSKNSIQTIRADTNFKQNTFEKFNNWNNLLKIINYDTFLVHEKLDFITAHFKESNNVTLSAVCKEYQNIENIIIEFKDPWFRDSLDNKGIKIRGSYAIWYRKITPFIISLNSVYKGVFLNQNSTFNPTLPIYSVKADYVQDIYLQQTGSRHKIYFQNWSAIPETSATFQNANALETPVIFKQENATVQANYYKGTQLSNNLDAYSNNSQRKFIRKHDGILFNVYESTGKIWLEESFDNGRTWVLANSGKPLSNNEAKTPSIAQIGRDFVIITYKEKSDNEGFYIKAVLFDIGWDRILDTKIVRNTEMKSYEDNSAPVVSSSRVGETVFMIVWREGDVDMFNPAGLYYIFGDIGYDGPNGYPVLNIFNVSGIIEGTDENSYNPTIVTAEENYNYPISYHLAWEQRYYYDYSEIYYSRIEFNQNGTINITDRQIVSEAYQSRQNRKPSITLNGERVIIGWIGHNIFTELSSAIQTRLYSGVYYEYSDKENVSSVNINKVSDDDFVFAWSFEDQNLSNKYIRGSNPDKINSANTNGNYLQFNNANDFYSSYILSYNNYREPYYFKLSNNIGSLGKEGKLECAYGRSGVISKNRAKFLFTLSDINIDGQKVHFENIPDSIVIGNSNIANNYLTTEPFPVSNNSLLDFIISYSVIDS